MCVSFIIHWHVQSVLSNDVMEFLPYVFQILAQLLELRPAPAPGTSNLTPGYESLFPPLLTATLWLRVGNVPALTQLMQVSLMLVVCFHRCMCTSRQQMAVFLHTVTPQHMTASGVTHTSSSSHVLSTRMCRLTSVVALRSSHRPTTWDRCWVCGSSCWPHQTKRNMHSHSWKPCVSTG